jgi:hypothetical protein
MRNIFDQYAQPENRLTHALISSLTADPGLLKGFLKEFFGVRTGRQPVHIWEQSLPGEALDSLDENEAERRGLPDSCITVGPDLTLLIESKFASQLHSDQLKRHARTAQRRGLLGVRVLALTVGPLKLRLSKDMSLRQWTDVYSWLQSRSRQSEWAWRCCEFMEVLEERESDSGYFKEGTLTVFSGIPFDSDSPYTYTNAKRLLRLLREELCQDKGRKLSKVGADVRGAGRSAITGRDHTQVWDYIPLQCAKKAKVFTEYPHLTLGLGSTSVSAHITIPNGVKSGIRARILGEHPQDFVRLISEVFAGFLPIVRKSQGIPRGLVVQRHYKTQRSPATVDSQLAFDLRTAIKVSRTAGGRVKHQPEWLYATYEALKSRRSNLQLQVGVEFPYDKCPDANTSAIVAHIRDVFIACAPLIDIAEQFAPKPRGRSAERRS